MSTNRVIFITGILVLAVPFAGFPRGWEEAFLVIAGLILILLSSLNLWQRSILNRLKFHSKQKVEEMPSSKTTHSEETFNDMSHDEEADTQYTP